MPRQLPWLNKGSSSTRTKARTTPEALVRTRDTNDSDDEFFAGTILQSAKKHKDRADLLVNDDLAVRPRGSSSSHRPKERSGRHDRIPSSSPPAAEDLPPPETEYMIEATDKFHLNDDEWMMVEDELLQTAKLFTRHLHLAEYERMKEDIKKQKKTMRPVVPDAAPSDQRKFQARAEKQVRTQKTALKNAFDSSKDDMDDVLVSSKRLLSNKVSSPTDMARQGALSPEGRNSEAESDDLNAFPSNPRKKTTTSTIAKKPQNTNFRKPAPPSNRNRTSRPSSKSVFDLLDEPLPDPQSERSSITKIRPKDSSRLVSPTRLGQTSTVRSSSFPTKPLQATSSRQLPGPGPGPSTKPKRTFTFFDDLDEDPVPKVPRPARGEADRSKRKAEAGKQQASQKRKSVKLDDIPTFLF